MIRNNLYVFVFIAFMAAIFTGPVVAQNLFLQGKSGENHDNRPVPKKKGFFSKLFFGKGGEEAQKQKKRAVGSINKAMASLDPDMLDPSGRAPTSAAEYLARADALSAPLSEAYKQQKALSNERVAIAQKIFKQRMKELEARAVSNQQNTVVSPVSFSAVQPSAKVQNPKSRSTTIRSKSPLFKNLGKNKNSSSSGVFKKY